MLTNKYNKMRIALIGYGKMGREIEAAAIARGHEVVLKIDINNIDEFTPENLAKADVAIEFTRPDTALNNVLRCLNNNTPVVCGTTGWADKLDEAVNLCRSKNGAFLWASNFSLGVNLFFKLNSHLAALMNRFDGYDASMTEVHHTQKLDIPSGTAITLAEGVVAELDRKKSWHAGCNAIDSGKDILEIESIREGNVPGIHTIRYKSEYDSITITHEAFTRKGFALGAVIAAEYIAVRKGVFSMDDVLFN